MGPDTNVMSNAVRPLAGLPPDGARAVVIARALSVPLLWLIGVLGYVPVSTAFHPVVVLALIWVLATSLPLLRGAPTPRTRVVLAVGDAAFLGVLLLLSGGLDSRIRHVVAMLPVVLFFTLGARAVLLFALWLGVVYTAVAAPDLGRDGAPATLATFWLILGWSTATGMLLAAAQRRNRRTISALVDTRTELRARLVSTEDRERRRLADDLHDHALQLVLAARQDARELGPGAVRERLTKTLDEATAQLRGLVREGHPVAVAAQTPHDALSAICARRAERAGFTWSVTVDPSIGGPEAELLVGIGRELVTNAAKHADASRIEVALTAGPDRLALTVRDDGRGMPGDEDAHGVGAGHVGLASCRDRVRGAGGTLRLDAAPGGGTVAVAQLPTTLRISRGTVPRTPV